MLDILKISLRPHLRNLKNLKMSKMSKLTLLFQLMKFQIPNPSLSKLVKTVSLTLTVTAFLIISIIRLDLILEMTVFTHKILLLIIDLSILHPILPHVFIPTTIQLHSNVHSRLLFHLMLVDQWFPVMS